MAAHFTAAAFLVVAVGAADGAQPLRRRAQMGGWSGDADGVCEKRAEGMWPGSEDMSHLGIEQNPRLLQTLVTEQATDGVAGYTTYRVAIKLHNTESNIYTIFGDAGRPLVVPPAYQVATPFGVHIGGANPAFFPVMPTAQYDSWLSVGLTDGDPQGDLSSVGIDWEQWDEQWAPSPPATISSHFVCDADVALFDAGTASRARTELSSGWCRTTPRAPTAPAPTSSAAWSSRSSRSPPMVKPSP